MKTVFNNSMLAHVWAQQNQPHGRSDSMRFEGSVAYSYAQPVAHIIKLADGRNVAIFTSRKWSVTTSQHVSNYRSAASHMTQFMVPDILSSERYRAADYSDPALHAKNLDGTVRAGCHTFKRQELERLESLLAVPA